MAFCPNCGTNVTEQASQCVACGQAIGTKAKGLRFKGTMMAVGGKLPAAISPNPQPASPLGVSTKTPVSAVATAPSKFDKGTAAVGVPDLTSATAAHPPTEAAAFKASPAKTPAAAPLGAAAPPPKKAGAPAAAPIVRSNLEAVAPPPRRPGTSGAPIVRSDTGTPGKAGLQAGDPITDATTARKTQGRFRAGSVPPALPRQDNGRLLVISVGGVMLIAAAGYAVAHYLGLLH